MSELVTQAEADAEQERSIREWVDGMTPEQRRALIDASNRRQARLKAWILAEIHAEGITEQEWIARQREASSAGVADMHRRGSGLAEAPATLTANSPGTPPEDSEDVQCH